MGGGQAKYLGVADPPSGVQGQSPIGGPRAVNMI